MGFEPVTSQYQLSFEATDAGSKSIVLYNTVQYSVYSGSHVLLEGSFISDLRCLVMFLQGL